MGADEEGALAALKAIRRELVDPRIVEHRGRIVKTTGDGLLVKFASVADTVGLAALPAASRRLAQLITVGPPADDRLCSMRRNSKVIARPWR